MKKRIGIKSVAAGILALAMGATVGTYSWYYYLYTTVIPATTSKLSSMAQKRVSAVLDHLSDKEEKLSSLAKDAKIIQFFKEKNETTEKLNHFLSNFEKEAGLLNTLFISPQGIITYSHTQPAYNNIDLNKPTNQTMSLARSFARSSMTLTNDVSAYEFGKVLKKPVLFTSIPVFDTNKHLVGVLAAQLNTDALFRIFQNYFDLGKTGDIIVGQKVKDGAQIVIPTRNDPKSAFAISEVIEGSPLTPLQNAVNGIEGSGDLKDYRNESVIAAWSYIPPLSWGLVLSMNTAEVKQPIKRARAWFHLSLFILLLAVAATIIAWSMQFMQKRFARHGSVYALSFFALFLLLSIGALGYYYLHLQRSTLASAHELASQKVTTAASRINRQMKQISQLAQNIAQDLSSGRLAKEDLSIRMERDLQENSNVHALSVAFEPYAFSKDKRLHAPHITNQFGSLKKIQLESVLDYSKVSTLGQPSAQWYSAPRRGEAVWLEPSRDVLSKEIVVRYGVPFHTPDDPKKVAGVVVISYAIDSLRAFLHKLSIGQTGYAFIVTNKGTFIAHPDTNLVEESNSIADLSQRLNNRELFEISSELAELKAGKKLWHDQQTDAPLWIHYKPINQTKWAIGIVFVQDEVAISAATKRHLDMGLLSLALLLCLTLAALFCLLFSTKAKMKQSLALASSIIGICALGILWYIIQHSLHATSPQKMVLIKNETNLTAFKKTEERSAAFRHEKLHIIPTTLIVHSFEFPDVDHISFTGIVWQKYPKESPLARTITIPNATEFESDLIKKEVQNTIETIGWKITATVPQSFDFSHYPFDQKTIHLPLSHPDKKVMLLLVPDFSYYHQLHQSRYIGLSPDFSLSEFSVTRTYFAYRMVEAALDNEDAQAIARPELLYVTTLSRDMLHAFIIYIIPLFVILFSLFAAMSFTKVTQVITSAAIIPYTAPLFALIILHGNLRRTFTVGQMLYIEYLFFLVYVTILLAVSYNLLIMRKDKGRMAYLKKVSEYLKIFFWPTQVLLWYVATIIAFY